MSNTGTTGRIPLWLVGTVVGTAALALLDTIMIQGKNSKLNPNLIALNQKVLLYIWSPNYLCLGRSQQVTEGNYQLAIKIQNSTSLTYA